MKGYRTPTGCSTSYTELSVFLTFTNDDVVDRISKLIFEESILDSLRKTAKNFPQRGRVSNPTGNFDGKRNEKIKSVLLGKV